MRTVAALVAIALLLLAGPLTGSALARTRSVPSVATATTEVDGPVRLVLTQVTPRLVTADGPDTITVEGTLTNTGTASVGALTVRLQRGEALRSEADVRTAFDGGTGTDAVTPQFTELPGQLAAGGTRPVRLTVPLHGDPATGLVLSGAGVYELLVNVNGTPQGGAPERLAAVRLLLPVLSLPAGATPGPVRSPVPFTLLYPIADAPRRLPTVPGEFTLLTDDDLAASFAPTGRLGGLVGALAQRAPVGSRLRDATCLAVDPDLVATAAAMRGGYQVLAPDGTRTPGRGAEAAGQWLAALTATARGGCVLALPFADADLVALVRGGLGDLAGRAVTDGRAIVADTLGTPVLPGALWPVDGLLDEPTLAALAAGTDQTSTALLSAQGVELARSQQITGVLPIAAPTRGQQAVLTDPLLTLAAGVRDGPDPTSPGLISAVTPASAPAGAALSTQDTIGALTFRAEAGPAADNPAPLVLAPSHQWAAGGVDALLAAAARLIDGNVLAPRALGVVATAGPPLDTKARRLLYPLRAGAEEVPPAVIDSVRSTGDDVARLRAAAEDEPGVGASLAAVFDPLRHSTLRATSSAWRGRPELAEQMATATTHRIAELRASVRVLEPPGPYSLGTSDAPLLLTVANGLPVTMKVQVGLSSTAGLTVAPIPDQRVPPLGRIQVRVSAHVTRAGQFSVDAVVRTPDGGALGPPSRLYVRSTAYGTITVWLTGIAGVLLVVLAARRIMRRIRGDRGRHAVPRAASPSPGPAGVPDTRQPGERDGRPRPPGSGPTAAPPPMPTPGRPSRSTP